VFCKAAGREDWLAVPEWTTADGRRKDRARLNAAIAEETRRHSAEWWIARLEEAGIPCGPINRIDEVFADPQVRHLGMATPMRHPRRGETHLVATPLNLDGLETGVRSVTPGLGEHTDEILAEAGLSPDEIAALRAAGAAG
jgi:formyl-CoA transferase